MRYNKRNLILVEKMKAHSLDFRQKIIQVYESKEISQRQIAKRFCISLSFTQKLIKQYRETGQIAAKPFAGGAKPMLNSSHLVILSELIETHNDATLKELVHLFQEQTGILISQATMGRMSQKLILDFKKKHFMLPKKRVSGCKSSERNTGQSFVESRLKT